MGVGVCGGDGKDCWPWVWAGGERSLRRQVEKCGGGEQVQSSGHRSKRDSRELDCGEGWGPARNQSGALQGEN